MGEHAWAADDNGDDPTHVMIGPNGDVVEDGDGQRAATDFPLTTRTTTVTTHDRPQPSITVVGLGHRQLNGSTLPEDTEGQRLVVGGGLGLGMGLAGQEEREGGEGGEGRLEKPLHMVLPLVVVVVCTLPLMVAWWFYGYMPHDVLIIVSITLSRLYLLRAALLPAAWFALPELRHLACRLWARLNGCGNLGAGGAFGEGGGASEGGAVSVAYSTLHESSDAPHEDRQRQARVEVRRVNPFDSDVRA